MNTLTTAEQAEEMRAKIAHLETFVEAPLPVEFVSEEMLDITESVLQRWLDQVEAPESVRRLIQTIGFWYFYQIEYYRNGGKINQEMAESCPVYLLEGMASARDLGYWQNRGEAK